MPTYQGLRLEYGNEGRQVVADISTDRSQLEAIQSESRKAGYPYDIVEVPSAEVASGQIYVNKPMSEYITQHPDVNPTQISSSQAVVDVKTGENVPYDESSQYTFEQNLDLALRQGQISPSSAEDLRANFYLLPNKNDNASQIIDRLRNAPPEYQDIRNLGFIAEQSIPSPNIPQTQNLPTGNEQFERERAGILEQQYQQQMQDFAQQPLPILTYESDAPTTLSGKFSRQSNELAAEYKRNFGSGRFNKDDPLGLRLGVGIAATSVLALGAYAVESPKNFLKGMAKSFTQSPQTTYNELAFQARENPIGFASQIYVTGKVLGVVSKNSPINVESATIGTEESIALGDIPPAAFRGVALTIKDKPKFFVGYKPVNSLNPSEFLNPEVTLSRNPPIVDVFPEKTWLGEPNLKLIQPISTKSQQAIYEKNFPNIPNIQEETSGFYASAQEGAKKLEFAEPIYQAKEQLLERRTSTPEAVQELYDYEHKHLNQIDKNFGSSVQEANIAPESRRIPGDTDILTKGKGISRFIPDIFPLNVLKNDIIEQQTIEFASGIPKAGVNLARERVVSETNPMLIEVSKTSPIKRAIGQHAEDIHFQGEDLGYVLPNGKLYGLQAIQKPEKLGGIPSQRFSEQLIAKRNAILQLRRIDTPEELISATQMGYKSAKKGSVVMMPEAHRLKDIVDYARVLEGVGAKDIAKKFREKLPRELFEEELPAVRGKSYRTKSGRVPTSRIIGSLNVVEYSSPSFSSIPPYSPSGPRSNSDLSKLSKSISSTSQSKISNPSRSLSPSKSLSPSFSPLSFSSSSLSPSSFPSSSSFSPSPSPSPSSSPYSSPYSKPYDFPYKSVPPILPPSKSGYSDMDFGFGKKGRRRGGYTSSLVAKEFGIKAKQSFAKLSKSTFSGLEIRGLPKEVFGNGNGIGRRGKIRKAKRR